MKRLQKQQARQLRTEGWSVNKIATKLEVSQSSVSLWVRDVELTEDQKRILLKKEEGARAKAGKAHSETHRRRRLECQEQGRQRVRLSDQSFIRCCLLYWAEGSKDHNSVGFTNSDVAMMRTFKKYLDDCYSLENDNYVICCHVYSDNGSVEEQEQFWLDALELSKTSLRKTMVDHYSKISKGVRKGRLPYGTCRLMVHRTDIIQEIFGGIQEIGGFSNLAWLS